jgi:hypothetical protein
MLRIAPLRGQASKTGSPVKTIRFSAGNRSEYRLSRISENHAKASVASLTPKRSDAKHREARGIKDRIRDIANGH